MGGVNILIMSVYVFYYDSNNMMINNDEGK